MCDICNKSKCCCNEIRISVAGKKADQGIPGKSSYIYLAYADNVVAGTPDVVTGFSLTTPKCWISVISSLIPLTPVEANFQGKWFNRCGNTIANLFTEVTGSIDLGVGDNFDTSLNTTIVTSGDYEAHFEGTLVATTTASMSARYFTKNGVNTGNFRRTVIYSQHEDGVYSQIKLPGLIAGDVISMNYNMAGVGTGAIMSKRSLMLNKIS